MCGDFRIKNQDNSVILCGHSMQFPTSQASEVVVFNSGEKFESTAPDGTKGIAWESLYGFTGISAFHIDAPDTGMNEAGLAFSVLILQATKYPEEKASLVVNGMFNKESQQEMASQEQEKEVEKIAQ